MNLKDIKELIGSHESYRGDCLDCGGNHSLSITNDRGDVKWLCFKAHCKNRGREVIHRTTKEITDALLGRQKEVDSDIPFDVPSHFTSLYSNDRCLKFFKRYQAIQLQEQGRVKLRYDPKQDRAVFLVTRKGRVVDATGRALGSSPTKWWRYNGSGQSFVLDHHGMGVPIIVVEDIPSACIVGYSYNAIALMGTSLSDLDLMDLMGYSSVIVALDPDAYSKGIQIARRLSPFVEEARAVLIPDDLKYYKPNEVKGILDVRT